MRLLTWDSHDELSLTDDLLQKVPYAILSHTWGAETDEVTFVDIQEHRVQYKSGYAKVKFCAEQARRDKINHVWIDTCCINKDSHVELSEAITSMFRWYQDAVKCYVYLSDVSASQTKIDSAGNGDHTNAWQEAWESRLRTSRWFTRGWTLQELLAPKDVEFFSSEGTLLGTKKILAQQIHEITKIPLTALSGTPLYQFSIDERMRWAEKRQTKKEEDRAYCLLGIFDVFMPLIYGEGSNAFRRLRREITEQAQVDIIRDDKQAKDRSLGLCLSLAPLIKPDDFIGRDSEIDAINAILEPEKRHVDQRKAVLGGMGGIGKTQLAIAYARQYKYNYTSIIWLNATSEATLFTSFWSIARALFPQDILEELSNSQILAKLLEWLSSPHNTQWLLIFDNYDDPEIFDIEGFYPNTGQGSIIVTTRLPGAVIGEQIRLQPLTALSDNLSILQTRSGRQNLQNDADARDLVNRLAGLPLALVTAGAYLCKSTISVKDYLDSYESRWQIDPRRPPRLLEYQNRTLYTTWDLSYSKLEAEDHEAAQMLKLLAYFDHQEIWYDLLQKGLSNESPAWLHILLTDHISFDSFMGTLVEYCLAEVQHTNKSYSLHSCVHDWTLGRLNQEIDPQLYWYAFDCVAASIDEKDRKTIDQLQYGRLSRHGVRLTHKRFEVLDQPSRGFSDRLNKAVWIAYLLRKQLQLSASEQIYIPLLREYENIFGPDGSHTLKTAHSLGRLYSVQGKFDEANQLYIRVLVGREKKLGPGHDLTLDTVHNLARNYRRQGKFDKAEELYTRALVGTEEAHGPNHTLTLTTVDDLGRLYHAQGKLAEAEQMYQRSLAGREKVLGLDHPTTLATRCNLGSLYFDRGKLEEAELLFKRALAGFQKARGPGHTSSLNALTQLGWIYHIQEKWIEAEETLKRALDGFQKALGPDHTSTLIVINDLGALYYKQNKMTEAEDMYTRGLIRQEKTLGPEHHSTLNTVRRLRNLYRDQGRSDEAKRMDERLPPTSELPTSLSQLD